MNRQLLLTAALMLVVGLAGGYWLAQQQKDEADSSSAACQATFVLSQSHESIRYLCRSGKGCHGHGLCPGLCR